jgi:hypothetical protein
MSVWDYMFRPELVGRTFFNGFRSKDESEPEPMGKDDSEPMGKDDSEPMGKGDSETSSKRQREEGEGEGEGEEEHSDSPSLKIPRLETPSLKTPRFKKPRLKTYRFKPPTLSSPSKKFPNLRRTGQTYTVSESPPDDMVSQRAQSILSRKFSNLRYKNTDCRNISRIVCTLTVIAHGYKTGDFGNGFSCLQFDHDAVKVLVNPKKCSGFSNNVSDRMLRGALDILPRYAYKGAYVGVNPYQSNFNTTDLIKNSLKEDPKLQGYLIETLPRIKAESQRENPEHTDFEQCSTTFCSKDYDPHTHITNKMYILHDHIHKHNAFIGAQIFYIDQQGILHILSQRIEAEFDYTGLLQGEGGYIGRILLSDIILVLRKSLRKLLTDLGCDEDEIERLILLLLLIILDASCNNDSSDSVKDEFGRTVTCVGGKNKKQKTKNKKQKTKNKKTKKQKKQIINK